MQLQQNYFTGNHSLLKYASDVCCGWLPTSNELLFCLVTYLILTVKQGFRNWYDNKLTEIAFSTILGQIASRHAK